MPILLYGFGKFALNINKEITSLANDFVKA